MQSALSSLQKYCHVVGISDCLLPSALLRSPLKLEYEMCLFQQTDVHVNASPISSSLHCGWTCTRTLCFPDRFPLSASVRPRKSLPMDADMIAFTPSGPKRLPLIPLCPSSRTLGSPRPLSLITPGRKFTGTGPQRVASSALNRSTPFLTAHGKTLPNHPSVRSSAASPSSYVVPLHPNVCGVMRDNGPLPFAVSLLWISLLWRDGSRLNKLTDAPPTSPNTLSLTGTKMFGIGTRQRVSRLRRSALASGWGLLITALKLWPLTFWHRPARLLSVTLFGLLRRTTAPPLRPSYNLPTLMLRSLLNLVINSPMVQLILTY